MSTDFGMLRQFATASVREAIELSRSRKQLGVSQTYVDAQRIVTALERAQQDPTYFDSAAEILNSYVEPERTDVIKKAIALGADSQIIYGLAQSGEVIEIVDKAPVVKIGSKRFRIPLWAIGASVLLGIAGAFAYKKWRVGKSILHGPAPKKSEYKKLATATSIPGIEKYINEFAYSTNYRVDPETLQITNSAAATPEKWFVMPYRGGFLFGRRH